MPEGKELFEDEAVDTELEQKEDIETLKQALSEEREKTEKYLANWQRAQADLANYRKRVEQERTEAIEFANSVLVSDLLGIVDDLARAFASLPSQLEKFSWIKGIRLIYDKFKAFLKAQGLSEIEAEGEQFDPHLHEAMMHGEGEDGVVVEEIQKGYKFKDKVIRPSRVVVGKGKEEGVEIEAKKEE